MIANKLEIGRKFKYKELGSIIEVIELDGERYFEVNGEDLHSFIDEDLVYEI